MYCQKCYTNLESAVDTYRCPKCARTFDPQKANLSARPFPPVWEVLLLVIGTTIVGLLGAGVVAFFQSAAASGH